MDSLIIYVVFLNYKTHWFVTHTFILISVSSYFESAPEPDLAKPDVVHHR